MMKMRLRFLAVFVCFTFSYSSQTPTGVCSINDLPDSINSFGFELTKRMSDNGNLFVSPLSIYTALAMIYLGAGGETAKQLEAALQMSSTGVPFHESYESLLKEIKNINGMNIGSTFFAEWDFPVNEVYFANAETFYQATAKNVNFLSMAEAAKGEINQWVATQTENKIPDFLSQTLDPSTVLAILNNIYFKGVWETQFNIRDTSDGLFHIDYATTKDVKMMKLLQTEFRYFHDLETHYTFLELPYGESDVVMWLALPQSFEYEFDMSSSMLCRINSSMTVTKLERVILPRFTLDFRTELKYVLMRLGVLDVFSSSANLSRFSQQDNLHVPLLNLASVIEVNEAGNQPTVVPIGTVVNSPSQNLVDEDRIQSAIGSTDSADNNAFEYVADHPFFFYIIDQAHSLVLFSGRVVDP